MSENALSQLSCRIAKSALSHEEIDWINLIYVTHGKIQERNVKDGL